MLLVLTWSARTPEASKAQLGLFGGGAGTRRPPGRPTAGAGPRPSARAGGPGGANAQLGLFSSAPAAGGAPAAAPARPPPATPAGRVGATSAAAPPPAGGQMLLFTSRSGGDPSHGGALHPERRTDATGRTQTRWVGSPDAPAAPGPEVHRPTEGPGSRLQHKIEVGEHVFGSRADLAARTPSDLERMSAAEARRLVTKARLLPGFDAEALRTEGKSPGYIVLRHAVERLVAAQPPDNHDARVAYMEGLDFLARSMDGCTSASDLAELIQEWHFLARGQRFRESFDSWDDARRERPNTPLVLPPITAPGERRVRIFAAADDLPRDIKANPYARMAAALGPSFARAVAYSRPSKHSGKTYSDAVWAAQRLDEQGWNDDTARRVEELTGTKARQRGLRNPDDAAVSWGEWTEKQVAGRAERVGGRPLGTTSSAQLAAAFGLRNVQFGNWVSDDDAREHVRNATGALHDLADVLGLEPERVSLKGRLGLGIGARGKGGAARAHYEADTKMINLTRWAGGGSLAHEWGHALDNLMAELHRGPSTAGAADFVSDAAVAGRRHAEMDGAVREAWEGVMGAIYGPRYAAAVELRAAFGAYQVANGRHGPHHPETQAAQRRVTDASRARAGAGADFSRYYRDSDAFNGKSARGGEPDGKVGYWTRPHELFARAFECYVEDKLKGDGRRNTYLVRDHDKPHPTGRYRDPAAKARGEHAWPYPLGDERQAISAAFDRLFGALRGTGAIYKALDALEARAAAARQVLVLYGRAAAAGAGR